MFHEEPFHDLQGDSGRSPWRSIAERNLTGICETCFQRRAFLPIDDRDLVSGLYADITQIIPAPKTTTFVVLILRPGFNRWCEPKPTASSPSRFCARERLSTP
jgi:hypothetical protein